MQTRESTINQQVERTFGITDSGVLGVIFNMFENEATKSFLETNAHYWLFPLAALLSLFKAIFSIRQAWLDKGKNGTYHRALVEGVTALAVTVAVVGGLVAASIFTTISPIIFLATLGGKSVYSAGLTLQYLFKAANTDNAEEKQTYRNTAFANFVGTVSLGLAAAAVGLVMIAMKPVFAFLGVIAGVIGVGYSLHKAFTTKLPVTEASEVSSSANIIAALEQNPGLALISESPLIPAPSIRQITSSLTFFPPLADIEEDLAEDEEKNAYEESPLISRTSFSR
jgi:hypothetical protein